NTYTVTVEGTQATGYTVTNTYVEPIVPTPLQPSTTSVNVTKVWVGKVSENSVQVQLYKNGQALGNPVTLNASNQWKHEFTDLLVVDTVDQKTPNVYTVKEVGEANNRVTVGDNVYTVRVGGTQATGYTVTNTYVEPTVPTPLQPSTTSVNVTKVWVGTVSENSVQVQLYKNGQALGNPVTLNATNQWKHEFTDLLVVDTVDQATPNVYTVKEVGEANNRVTVGNHTYTVTVEGTQATGYTVTNTYVEPIVPTEPSDSTTVPSAPSDSTTVPSEPSDSMTVPSEPSGSTTMPTKEQPNSNLPNTGNTDYSVYSFVLFIMAGVVYSFRYKKERIA
ncbi:Cna B-type domain-containing protein, partial [Carnobacteriaceae bacterium zg-ZUI240]|nr:Cna B-type domain-containing protein [Carnobacteriaceae bacterium zg-ZUI240]